MHLHQIKPSAGTPSLSCGSHILIGGATSTSTSGHPISSTQYTCRVLHVAVVFFHKIFILVNFWLKILSLFTNSFFRFFKVFMDQESDL